MDAKIDYSKGKTVENIDTIYITGGGFINRAFKGASKDSACGWEEPAWGGDLNRSTDFILTNIEDVPYGLVSRCEISYQYMTAQDYFDLMKISKERTVIVNFFNRETGQRVTQQMAFTGNELSKLYAYGTKYLGVQGVQIKLVATNKEKANLIKSTITIEYKANGGTGSTNKQTAKWSNTLILFDNASNTFKKAGAHIKEWNTSADGSGASYGLGQHITCWTDLTLYAIWESA